MNLSKLTLAAGALTAAAFATVPFQAAQEGQATGAPPAVDGLLRPAAPQGSSLDAPSGQPLRPVDSPPQAGPSQNPPQNPPQGSPLSQAQDSLEIEERLRRRLAALDLDVREEAFDAAVDEAARSAEARTALHAISEDAGDPDLAFTARLALREANRRRTQPATPVTPGETRDPFDSIQRRMDGLMRSDPFLNDFFSGDPFSGDPFFGRSGGRLFGARPDISLFGRSGDPFEEMRQRTEEIRRQFEGLRSRAGGSAGQGAGPGSGPGSGASPLRSYSSSSSMSIENTPAGVRVEITEDNGDGPNTRVYEAPSMEALLEANPELKGRIR